jgi:hypothetical protein
MTGWLIVSEHSVGTDQDLVRVAGNVAAYINVIMHERWMVMLGVWLVRALCSLLCVVANDLGVDHT